jgi:hypothetical protein
MRLNQTRIAHGPAWHGVVLDAGKLGLLRLGPRTPIRAAVRRCQKMQTERGRKTCWGRSASSCEPPDLPLKRLAVCDTDAHSGSRCAL